MELIYSTYTNLLTANQHHSHTQQTPHTINKTLTTCVRNTHIQHTMVAPLLRTECYHACDCMKLYTIKQTRIDSNPGKSTSKLHLASATFIRPASFGLVVQAHRVDIELMPTNALVQHPKKEIHS